MINNDNINIEDLLKELGHLKKTLEELKSNTGSPTIQNKEYRLLFEHLSSGFSYHDVIFDAENKPIDCRYIEVNKAFEDILGFKRENIIGKTFIEIQQGKVEDFWMEIYGKVSKTGASEKFEQYSQLLNKYLEVIAYSPQHGKFVTIFNDITHKKLYEKKLQKQALINKTLAIISKKLLSSSLSISSIANYILENSSNITESKFGFISLINHELENNITYVFNNSDENNNFTQIKLNQHSKNSKQKCICNDNLYNSEASFNNLSNKIFLSCENQDIELDIRNFLTVPIFIEAKLIGQIILANSNRDYTKEDIENIEQIADIFALAIYRIQSEDILREAKERAEESDKLKSTFLENMSHEIRTPMNGILGFAELLKDTDLQQEQKKEYISYIGNSCNVLTKIIDDIIDISKIEAKQLKINKTKFLLSQLMNEIHKQFSDDKNRQNKSEIEIIYSPGTTKGLFVNTDQTRLAQIFYNLLSNALKFTNRGKIEFGYEIVNNNSLKFFVKDTGIGIHVAKQEIIFERFRQVDESQHRTYGGAGLGLAISKNLAELLGGKIWLSSVIKQGTTFYFALPIA